MLEQISHAKNRTVTARSEDIKSQIVAEWSRLLSELPSTQEHASFLSSHGLTFTFSAKESSLASFAPWEPSIIKINGKILGEAIEALKSESVSSQKIAHIVAVKTLPLIAHEIRHAMTQDRLKTHGIGSCMFLENEMISHTDEVGVIADMKKHKPILWQSYSIPHIEDHYIKLEQAWNQPGPEKFLDFVFLRYGNKDISVFSTSDELTQYFNPKITERRNARQRLNNMLSEPDPELAKQIRDLILKEDKVLSLFQDAFNIVSDSTRWADLKSSYTSEIQRVIAQSWKWYR
ncbi:MAG: hypothetical protein HY400_02880 [Elusimicrobia bacterium]|nr:hypothetical protein [Elusimicrobiota bacterium]